MAIDAEKIAFEMFADVYPHEAAEADWQAFVAYTQSKNPAIPEEEIRRLLKETAGRNGRREMGWPRLTKKQREVMLNIERLDTIYVSGARLHRTVLILYCYGFVRGFGAAWYSLTQRGRDYMRFGMRR